MKQHWDKLSAKIDAMSLRERALVFAAVAFMLITLVNTFLINPLIVKQKLLSEQIVQKQERLKETRAIMEALQEAGKNDRISPLRKQLALAKQQMAESDAYMQNLRQRLVAPEKMVDLLQKVLRKDGQLELVSLQSLPVAPLIAEKVEGGKVIASPDMGSQVFKHSVKITLRGSYKELLQYLTTLEQLPVQMFWGTASMKVVQPSVELTLTLYTLSLDKTWLQI
jgi:MSHA biogenesis protein MshJ